MNVLYRNTYKDVKVPRLVSQKKIYKRALEKYHKQSSQRSSGTYEYYIDLIFIQSKL